MVSITACRGWRLPSYMVTRNSRPPRSAWPVISVISANSASSPVTRAPEYVTPHASHPHSVSGSRGSEAITRPPQSPAPAPPRPAPV